MMNNPGVKIQFLKANLIKAAERVLGFNNVVIENDNDARSIINSLIGVSGDGTYYEKRERPCRERVVVESCKTIKEFVIVSFEAKDDDYTKEFL